MDQLVDSHVVELWGLLGALLGTLALLAGTFWAGRQVSVQAREAWRVLRGRRTDVIAAVDDPRDPLVLALAQVSRLPAGVWAAFLPAFVDGLAGGLDRVLSEEASPNDS